VIFANKMPPKISKEKQPSQTKSPHTTTKSSTGSSGAMQIISLTLFGAARFLSRRAPSAEAVVTVIAGFVVTSHSNK
jgi:hypothetical protein